MFRLPKLSYSYKALEPYIDGKTMKIHHTKHHQSYIDNLNNAIKGDSKLDKLSVEDLLRTKIKNPSIANAVRNHGGGHANHSMFWKILGPSAKVLSSPRGELESAINSKFGSLESFKVKFAQEAIGRFGSGWGWLVVSNKKLKTLNTANQDSPIMKGDSPILGIDVWEHAYYLKYQNRRADYIRSFWKVVNWEQVEVNFKKAIK